MTGFVRYCSVARGSVGFCDLAVGPFNNGRNNDQYNSHSKPSDFVLILRDAYMSRIGEVSANWFRSYLVGKSHFYNSTLMNGGCTNEQDNKDK